MKKFILILFALVIFSFPAMADSEVVSPVLESRPLQVNFLTRRKKNDVYPYLNYSDVIYIPLDGYHRAIMGIDVAEDENGIYITHTVYADNADYRQAYNVTYVRDAEGNPYTVDYSAGVKVDMNAPAVTVDKPVYLDNYAYADPEVQFFTFNDALYMPLSWQTITKMNWLLDWDGSAYRLYGDSRFMMHDSPANWGNDYTDYYVVSGRLCARVGIRNSARVTMQHSLYIPLNGVFTACRSYASQVTNKMEIKDGILTTVEYKYDGVVGYGMWPGQVAYTRTYDVYTVTRDAATGEVISAERTDRVDENMYGLLENSVGELVYTVPEIESAYYDGGHVILNNTMMRSYNLVLSNIYSDMKTSYWIRVEDLENYGYSMVTDFENRATYFYRDTNTPITPMSFDGTDEQIPIYESDWKIYIDGNEPRLYYNIGGYTLIFAGELGEYSIDTLDGNYNVMRVTTN